MQPAQTEANAALPRWDMSVVFPGLDSPEYAAAVADLVDRIERLAALCDERGIGAGAGGASGGDAVETVEAVLRQLNDLLARAETIGAYVDAFVATDANDALAQARASELRQRLVPLSQLQPRIVSWLGRLDLPPVLARSDVAQRHAFVLEQAKIEAVHQMSPAEEDLAAALHPASGAAWSRLYGDVTARIVVELEVAGERRELPLSAVRNLAHDPDRDVRRRAYEAELAACGRWAVPLAAALNSIKGLTLTLSGRRGWAEPLDQALFANRIDRPTFEAMLAATRAALPNLRRYLQAKARALGLPALAWYDLVAPVGALGESERWSWPNAIAYVLRQFGTYSPRLRDLAARAVNERWIDAPPRPGKRDGAFCMGVRGEESRILVNFVPTYAGVATLAHELGHAYHNLNEAGLSPLLRQTPLTLAETASIFCETIVREAALAEAVPAEELAIREAGLQEAAQITLDIVSRFRFESAVFARRRERDLAVEELNELMLAAQRDTYGNGLDQTLLHPFMWSVKGHYYSVGRSYYNFPYLFGYLFGQGLWAQYRRDPERFCARYDDLLASTGRADAATLAAGWGIDLRSPEFWAAGLAVTAAEIDRFVALVDAGRLGPSSQPAFLPG